MNTWALQDAKNQLSEVVRRALREGAQEITVRGEPAVTVIATSELQQLRPPQGNIVDFFLASPLRGAKSIGNLRRNHKDDGDKRKIVF
jgi:antitoxin Phd